MKNLNPKIYTLKQAKLDLQFLNQKILKTTEQFNTFTTTVAKLADDNRKFVDQKIYIKSVISSKEIKRSKDLKLRKELMNY